MAFVGYEFVMPGPDYNPFNFIYVLTAIFGTIFVVGPLLVPRGENQEVIRISIMEAAFLMWVVWVTIYISQMYPVTGLIFRNTTLAWISYAWGNGAGEAVILSAPTTTTTSTTLPPTTTTRTTTTRTTTTTKSTTRTTTTSTTTTTTSTTSTTTNTEEPEPFFFKIYEKSDGGSQIQETNFRVPENKVSTTEKKTHRIEFAQRHFCKETCFIVCLRWNFTTVDPHYQVHVDPWWIYMIHTNPNCGSFYNNNYPGNTGPNWKSFWVEWTSDPGTQRLTVTVGRLGETKVLGKFSCDFMAVSEVDFQSDCLSEVKVLRGLEMQPAFANIAQYGLRRNLKPKKIRIIEFIIHGIQRYGDENTNFKVPVEKVSNSKNITHRIEFDMRTSCSKINFVVHLRKTFDQKTPNYEIHIGDGFLYFRHNPYKFACSATYLAISGLVGAVWNSFWIEWNSDPVTQKTTVTLGEMSETTHLARYICNFMAIGEVDFQSSCRTEVRLKGLEKQRVEAQIKRKLKKKEKEKWRTYTDELNVTDSYKYYVAREEPIQIGVFLGKHLWREFFVSLVSDQNKRQPRILIHIGESFGRFCNIAKNGVVVVRVKCDYLEWRRDTYLQFWIYYKNGKIFVKSGYSKPGPYKAFLTWEDPEPFKVILFAVRTAITDIIPMAVVDKEDVNFLKSYGLE